MTAIAPVIDYVFALEGFECAAFWLALFVSYLITGYLIDLFLRDLGLGPFLDGLVVLAAVLAGIYIRCNYFRVEPWFQYEPYVTITLCVSSPTLALTAVAILRSRRAL